MRVLGAGFLQRALERVLQGQCFEVKIRAEEP